MSAHADSPEPYVFGDWDDTEWMNHVPEDLYLWRMPARFYLGTGGGCRWTGPGYFYEPWGSSREFVSLAKRVASSSAWKTAGSRLKAGWVRTAVYRLRNDSGDLLYIGISDAPLRRWAEHAADKAWWPEVAQFNIEWLENREKALAAEALAIRSEQPRYNVVHNVKPAT